MAGFMPLMLDLKDKKAVVVGGGNIAAKRIQSLIPYKPHITVISPEITGELERLVRTGQITWKKKRFSPEDIKKAFIVIHATDNPELSVEIRKSIPKHVLFNDAVTSSAGNVHFPAFIRRGMLTVAVSTGGASPFLAKKVKRQLEKIFDEDYARYVDFLAECRSLIKQSDRRKEEQHFWLQEILQEEYMHPEKQKQFLKWLKSTSEK